MNAKATNRFILLNYTFIISQAPTTQKNKKVKVKKASPPSGSQVQKKPSQATQSKSPKKPQAKGTTKQPKKKLLRKTRVKRKPVLKKRKGEDQVPDELKWLQEDPQDQLLSRFVETPKGTIVGESIGIEKSRIILKNKLKFYSVPLKYIKEKDEKLILRRKINWTQASKLGEIWRKNALDLMYIKKQKKSQARKAK